MTRGSRIPALLVLLFAGCGGDEIPPCPDRAADLERRLLEAEETLHQVQPWNGAGADPGVVPPSALAAAPLPFQLSDTSVAVHLTAEGERLLGDRHLEPGRATLCQALSLPPPPPPTEADSSADAAVPTVRAHIAATADASRAAELLVDLWSCGGPQVDLVFRRDPQPELVHPPTPEAPPPEPGTCPGTEEMLAVVLENVYVPETFLTVLPVRLSPEEVPFQVKQGERWDAAAQRLAAAFGTSEAPVPLWVAGAGTLAPVRDPSVLLQAPWTPVPGTPDP